MTTAAEAMDRLDGHSVELDSLSKALAEVGRRLEPVELEYDEFIENFEVGLFLRSQEENGPKMPSEAIRLALARREMKPELLGAHEGLRRKRERLRQRIGDLKATIEADRSILSALKLEVEAAGGSLRRAA